jgi:methionine synthase / methylenetetrahydrofolate reductase(NADPH)
LTLGSREIAPDTPRAMNFLDAMMERPLAADGAMGTELFAAGAARDACLEELCVSAPEIVRGVHERYLGAGARMIRTNSFGANAVRLARHGFEHRVAELNWTAAQIAKDCARGKGIHVAGSVGPLGISAEEAAARGLDRTAIFTDQIGALLDGGARVIFLETFTDLDELLIAVNVKHSLHHCPVVASVTSDADGRLACGQSLREVLLKLRDADVDVFSINCVGDPATTLRALECAGDPDLLATFPSAGVPVETDAGLKYPASPYDFAQAVPDLVARGARLIGGCCGTGPAHVEAIAEAIAAL